jgi:hypothetical protein
MLTGEHGRESMNTVAGLEANTIADGFFHLAAWVLIAVGSWLMLRAWQQGRLAPPWRLHVGMLLVGWGSSTSLKVSWTTSFWAFITSATTSAVPSSGTWAFSPWVSCWCSAASSWRAVRTHEPLALGGGQRRRAGRWRWRW